MNPEPSVPPRRFLTVGAELALDRQVVLCLVSAHYTDLPRARPWLRLLREKYRIPAAWRIDGPALFDAAGRERAGLRQIDDAGARALVDDVVGVFNRIPCLLRFAYLPLRGDQTADSTRADLRAMALDVPPDGTQGPPAADCDVAMASEPDLTADALRLGDLASLIAFVCLRAQAGRPEDLFFQQQVLRLKYWSRADTVALLVPEADIADAAPAGAVP